MSKANNSQRLLFLAEQIVLVFILLAVLLYHIYGIPFRSPITLYVARLQHSLVFYALGLFLSIFFVRLGDLKLQISSGRRVGFAESFQNYKKKFLSVSSFIHDLRLFNAIALMFVTYIHLKHLIPLVNDAFLDDFLIKQERAIFGGEIAALKLHSIFGTDLAPLLSYLYKFFYPFVAFSIVFFIIQRDRSLAQSFCAAFVLTWFVGILMVYLLPTMGPCFLEPSLFNALPHTEVTDMQEKLWRHKVFMDANPMDPRPVYLISGLPSLHLAVPMLTAIFLRKSFRTLSILCWGFVALTAVTTIYFGWHYIVDDLASIVLVLFVLWLAKSVRRDYAPC